MQWWYADGGKQVGPLSEADLVLAVKAGKVGPATLVWREGMSNWLPMRDVPDAPQSAPPPPPFAAVPPAAVPPPAQQTAIPAAARTLPLQPESPADQTTPAAGGTGDTPNAELMRRARASLDGSWGTTVLALLVSNLISSVASCVAILIEGALMVGVCSYLLNLIRTRKAEFGEIFEGFQIFGKSLGTFLLYTLFILLWSCLCIIPGIIAGLAYDMTFFILTDNGDIGCLEAIRRSKQMMRGLKWKLFCLHLRFLGWALLCLLAAVVTCGLGLISFLWLAAYVQAARAHFYEDAKGRVAAS